MSLAFCQTGQISSLDDLKQVCIETNNGYCTIPIDQLSERKNLPLACKPVAGVSGGANVKSTSGATRIIVPPNAVAYAYNSTSDNLPRSSILGSYYYENLYQIPNNASQTMGSLENAVQLQVMSDSNFIGNCANQTASVTAEMCGSIYGQNPSQYPASNVLPGLPIPQAAQTSTIGFWIWFIFGLSLVLMVMAIIVLFFGVAGRAKQYKAKLTGTNLLNTDDSLVLADNSNLYKTI